jgi:hypothetical protein
VGRSRRLLSGSSPPLVLLLPLLSGHRSRGLTIRAATYSDVLRVGWPGELSAVPPTTVVGQRAKAKLSLHPEDVQNRDKCALTGRA